MRNAYKNVKFDSFDFNVIKFNLETENLLDTVYDLYEESIKQVCVYLENKNINKEECGIADMDEYALEVKNMIKKKFIDNKKLDWKSYLDTLLSTVYEKYFNNLTIIDDTSSNEDIKYEQYIDILSNMFGNIEEYIEIEYRKFEEKRACNVGNVKLKYSKVNSYSRLEDNSKNSTNNFEICA